VSDTGRHSTASVPSGPQAAEGETVAPDIELDDPIIDLTDPEGTWQRVERDLNPFERLDKPHRMRLMIQVLCELVAFDELDENGNPVPKPESVADEDDTAAPADEDATSADHAPVAPIGERRTTARSMAEPAPGS
jgi:hypothetical protein